ncbi:MAG: energy transducer TonB [Acidobacteriota bacterium]|nr:energy transducer TonB [Acidobacteriota bacterium]
MKRYGARVLLFSVVFAADFASPAAAQDYSEIRLREGRDAYRARRPVDAIDPLRVAAFGLLDRPAQLCAALVFLALAQETAVRHSDAQASLERLSDVERRFPACAAADVDSATRSEFESRFHRRLFAVLPATGPSPAADPSPAALKPATLSQDGTTPARIRKSVPPVYPRFAREARVGGTVVTRVLVSETGRPLQVEVIRGVRPDLADAAVASIQKWTFDPARRGGRDVQSWMTIEIPFRP